MPALLCVPILVQDEPSALADAQAARDAGADIVEFRIDEFFSGSRDAKGNLDAREVGAVLRMVSRSPLPCIVTCRSNSEGGHYDGDDAARVSLYERLGLAGRDPGTAGEESPPKYLDLEHSTYVRSANLRQKVDLAVDEPRRSRDVRSSLILSMHDFQGRPPDLWRRVEAMQGVTSARVVKVAITARSVRDNLDLFDLLTENAAGRPMIALAMGRFGLMSRVLASKFRGFLTFASLRPGSATAPGQPTVRDLVDVYRFRAVTPSTRVFGVIGWPVEHSLSPLAHNAGFEALAPDPWELADDPRPADPSTSGGAFSGIYLPIPVPPEYEHFKATLGALIDHPRLDFHGASITLPHKEHLVRFAREAIETGDEIRWSIDELASACGAANTLVVQRDRLGSAIEARVLNTDARAAAGCLAHALSGGLAGKHIAILGAGGVARSVAAGALEAGASVSIHNRAPDRAESLVRHLAARPQWGGSPVQGRLTAAPIGEMGAREAHAVVNCTPVGMTGGPAPDASVLEASTLARCGRECVVMDTVYTPLQTPLLRAAAAAGMRTIDGLEMFVRQAGAQFSLWTGRPAPTSLFRRVCIEALTERSKAPKENGR